MEFKEYLEKSAKEINREVEKILDQQLKDVGKIDRKLIPLLEAFKLACMGGKRIRGTLVKLGYEIAMTHLPGVSLDSARDKKAHLEGGTIQIGAAYEIMHAAILVHDDIIDKSLVRRSQSSLYSALGGNHYGSSQAISLGDLGFFLSIKIISESKFPEKEKNKALSYFSRVMMDTSLGEILELIKGDVLTVARLKTARYTVSGPLMVGAVLGGGSDRIIRQLEQFGENLGIAFQIKDDILDSDGYSVGGEEYAKQQAEQYKDQAMKILPSITKSSNMNTLLMQMAEYLVERSR